ncbi:MAG: hypothetical protein R6U15_00950 [Candidatus Izemoplasmatales bacterium]
MKKKIIEINEVIKLAETNATFVSYFFNEKKLIIKIMAIIKGTKKLNPNELLTILVISYILVALLISDKL